MLLEISTLVIEDIAYTMNTKFYTWHKVNAMPNMTKRVYTHSSEFIVWGVKGKNWTFNYEKLKKINPEKQNNGLQKQMRDVWVMPLVQAKERVTPLFYRQIA